MGDMGSFFVMGWDHIITVHAIDHVLFVMTLCAAFAVQQWRQILVIVTAFTIGHSATLVLSALDFIFVDPQLAETLIPFTIMITAITNIINYENKGLFSNVRIKYGIALAFGLIHGLAFASNFKVMLYADSIVMPLFLFNLGIEAAQLFVVALFMLTLWIYTKQIKGEHYKWNLFISGAGFGVAATMFLTALFES